MINWLENVDTIYLFPEQLLCARNDSNVKDGYWTYS